MLIEVRGDLLSTLKNKPLLCVPVNTVGVAGKGLACWMRMRYPEAYSHYRKVCRRGNMAVGDLTVVGTADGSLAMFPTKHYWGNPSDVELIRQSACRLLDYMRSNGINEAVMPRVGCGNRTGTLNWESEVKPVLLDVFSDDDVKVYVYTK